ncbi:MAG: hypothetical protein ACPGYU_05615 [Flavobacteriaceae bacterium]
MRYIFFLFFACSLTFSSAQNDVLIEKLKSSKELLSLGLLTQVEYDSIAKDVKSKILRSYNGNDLDGFYHQGKRIVPEVFANHKMDILGTVFSFGLAGGGTKSILTGSSSMNKINRDNQEMILNITRNVDFGGNAISTISNEQNVASAQSPANFILVPLKVNLKKEQRSIKIGSLGLLKGPSFQIDPKLIIDFNWEAISNLKFRIRTNLTPGEYAFVYKGTTSQFSSSPIFSFSVN